MINDEETASSDSNSRLSHDEARAALDLLYQKHVQPAIDTLNYYKLKQVRLLVDALATNDDGVRVVGGERSSLGYYWGN